jgi:hypothetical protein
MEAMSDPSTIADAPQPTWKSRLWRVARTVIVVLFVMSLVGMSEFSAHVAMGWTNHLRVTFPGLLSQWTGLLVLLGCLTVACWLVHRLIRWRLQVKGSAANWRAAHTLFATAIILLGAWSTIALKGAAQQAAWLSNKPLYERRGPDFIRADAMNSASQILFALGEFHSDQERYPDSLDDLSLPSRIIMIRPSSGAAPEPFVYFKPPVDSDPDTVVLVSPVLRPRDVVVVVFLSGTKDVYPAASLAGILETGRMPDRNHHER